MFPFILKHNAVQKWKYRKKYFILIQYIVPYFHRSVLECRSPHMGIQHVNNISTIWIHLNAFCLHFWAVHQCYFNSGNLFVKHFGQKLFKITATCSVILLHHAKTCTHFMFDFCIQILSEATVYVYTHTLTSLPVFPLLSFSRCLKKNWIKCGKLFLL